MKITLKENKQNMNDYLGCFINFISQDFRHKGK